MYRPNQQANPELSPPQRHQYPDQHSHHHYDPRQEPQQQQQHQHPHPHQQPMSYSTGMNVASNINLPPISSMDFSAQTAMNPTPQAPYLPPPSSQQPAGTRTLPPLPQYYNASAIPHTPEYVTAARPMYSGLPPPYMPGTRLPIPSSAEGAAGLMSNRPMHKIKEVKRRTKTGCMTCRKRRIKCDESRPECRNCIKSKRMCSGYDQSMQSPSQTTPPGTLGSNPDNTAAERVPYRHHDQVPPSPTGSSHASMSASSPQDSIDHYYQRPSESHLPPLQQPHGMSALGNAPPQSYPRCKFMMDANRPFPQRKTIEDLCCIGGQRAPHAPPLPPDQTPNLDSIRKVYDTAFAVGLDKFLETGPSRWFATQGFNHLVSDRELLGQFLLYLTIVSNNSNPMQPENALVSSQEARITWALLNLMMKPAHDGNEEAEKIARRVKAVEALLTGEASLVVRGSMSDFIHQEDAGSDTNPEPITKQDINTAFEKQLNRRSDDFWRQIEKFAESPRQYPPYNRNQNPQDPSHPISQTRPILDGLENRDIIYSMMLLGTSNGQENEITSRPGTAQGNNGSSNSGGYQTGLLHHQQQIALSRRFLDNEAGGKATNLVFQVIAGMARRAFQYD